MENITKEKIRFNIKDGVILVLRHPNDEDESIYTVDKIINPSMDLELDKDSSNEEILNAMYLKIGRKLLDDHASELIDKKNIIKNIDIFRLATELQERLDERVVCFTKDGVKPVKSACLSKYTEKLSDLWIYVGDFTEDEIDVIRSISPKYSIEGEELIEDEKHKDYINVADYAIISNEMTLKLDTDYDKLNRIHNTYTFHIPSTFDIFIEETLTIMDFEKMSEVLSSARISLKFVPFDTEDLDDLKYELSNPSHPIEEIIE